MYNHKVISPLLWPQHCLAYIFFIECSSYYKTYGFFNFDFHITLSVSFGDTKALFSKRKHPFLTALFYLRRFSVNFDVSNTKFKLVVFELF